MPAIIFDVEGTLSDHTHRLHLVPDVITGEAGEWWPFQDEFKNDPPNKTVVTTARSMGLGCDLIISTGLSSRYFDDLVNWLHHHCIPFLSGNIYMRDEHMQDLNSPQLKLMHLQRMRKEGYNPIAIYDDQLDVCQALSSEGLQAFHLPFQGFKQPLREPKS